MSALAQTKPVEADSVEEMAAALAMVQMSEGGQEAKCHSITPYRPVEAGKPLPDTVELRDDPVKGEGLFAGRAISVREPVFAIPYSIFMAIESEKLATTCYSCLAVTSSHIPYIKGTAQEDLTLKKCAGCSQVSFCNQACQAKAWKAYHKLECKIYSYFQDNFPPLYLRAVMHVVLLRDKRLLPQKYWDAMMDDLDSHEDIWMTAPANNITAMVKDIKIVTQSKISMKILTRLFWVMRTNSIELPTSVHGGIGTMLDPIFSKINHSCDANVMLYRPWHTSRSGWNLDSSTHLSSEQRSTFAAVVPLRDIKEGEELTISYSDPTAPIEDRKEKHMQNHFFECTCSQCIADTKAAADVEDTLPLISAEYVAWSDRILEQLEELQRGSLGGYAAFEKVSQDWDKGIARYLKYPTLYTASHFDQISLHQSVTGLGFGAFDIALINLLRPYFLIYPSRIPGRHNYSNTHIMVVMLETFDILLGVNSTDKTVDEPKEDQVKQSLKALKKRGLKREALRYWRQRICQHLRDCLEVSAVTDLLPLVAKMQARMPSQPKPVIANKDAAAVYGVGESNLYRVEDVLAMDAMRIALQLSEERWVDVLKETGC